MAVTYETHTRHTLCRFCQDACDGQVDGQTQRMLEENPVAAAWFRQRYREALASVFPASGEDITRLYGSLEHCGFSRW